MKVLHTVTYTVNSVEQTVQITRSSRLTYAGAQRIIRRTCKGAIVTRIEAMVDAR